MNELYIIIPVTIASLVSLIVVLIEIITKNRSRRYDEQLNRVRLDETRIYYEEKLHKIQSELVENERRWADVNHLILSAQKEKELSINNNESTEKILKNFGVDSFDFSEDKKSVFVLTPFLDKEYETFEIIKKTCVDVNLSCTRGDEVFRDKDILSHIIESIAKSSVIIANINGRNPNVFYELGICHSMGKPVILVSKNKNNLPFDIQSKNIVFYNDLTDLQAQLKNELLKIFIDRI